MKPEFYDKPDKDLSDLEKTHILLQLYHNCLSDIKTTLNNQTCCRHKLREELSLSIWLAYLIYRLGGIELNNTRVIEKVLPFL